MEFDPPPGAGFRKVWTCPECGAQVKLNGFAMAAHRRSKAHREAVAERLRTEGHCGRDIVE